MKFRSVIWNSFLSDSIEGIRRETEFLSSQLMEDGVLFYFLPASNLQQLLFNFHVNHWSVRDSHVFNPQALTVSTKASFLPSLPIILRYKPKDDVKLYERLLNVTSEGSGDIACSNDIFENVNIACTRAFRKCKVLSFPLE